MKILILANQLLGPNITSGGDVIFIELAKRWARKNELVISVPRSVVKTCQEKIDPLKTIELVWTKYNCQDASSIGVPLLLPLYKLRALEGMIKISKEKPDAVYTTGDFICNTIPAAFLKLKHKDIKWTANIFHLNRPPIFRSSNPFWRSLFSYLIQRFSLLFIRYFADQVFLLNTEVKDALLKRKFKKEKLFTVGAGLDLKTIKKTPRDPNLDFDGCFLGRLNYTKGAFELPEIWAKVVKRKPDAKLAIIGQGAEDDLKKMILEIGKYELRNQVQLFGFLETKSMYQILKASKVFILPSHEEGWGISLCEAIACGAAPVTYDLPVFAEVFPGGLTKVPVGQKQAMALKIVELLNNPEKRKRLVVEGQKVVEKYDWDELAEREIKIIQNTVTGNG